MKRYLSSLLMILVLLIALPVQAQSTYRHYFIAISDALMQTKQQQDEEAQKTLVRFNEEWQNVTSDQATQKKAVDEALALALRAGSHDDRLAALTDLSNALVALDKAENPVDEAAQRAAFGQKMKPVLQTFEQAVAAEDVAALDAAYKTFNASWNKNERPVREQSIAMYGQIETQMAFIRIAISEDEPNMAAIQTNFDALKQSITDFVAGKETAEVVEGEFSLQTLLDHIAAAKGAIADEDYNAAADEIRAFIMVWPRVEMDISTRDSKLYTKIESTMPLVVSGLTKKDVDADAIDAQLDEFATAISLIAEKTDYTFWDAALILLREGLEAMLIIMALVTFLQRANQQHLTKWVYVGALAGVVLSVVAAFAMSLVFSASSMDANREIIEGYVGLIAAAMMIGVGVWLHTKSTANAWNDYIERQMGRAISTGSVVAMAMISFLSVFREGAETVIFYMGIAPSITAGELALGVLVAVVVLALVAFMFVKTSVKIPIHLFFKIATVFIYVLAFKIIGVSVHTLQLMNKVPTHIVDGVPMVPVIGLYPTVETLVAQAILLSIITVTMVWQKRQR